LLACFSCMLREKYARKQHKIFGFFTKAYDLYFNRPHRIITPDIIEEILKLKNGMNRQRTNFNRPIPINITDYWLLVGLLRTPINWRWRVFPFNKIEVNTRICYKNGCLLRSDDQEPLMLACQLRRLKKIFNRKIRFFACLLACLLS